MFQNLEAALRIRGDNVYADQIAHLVRIRGEDIPLCKSTVLFEQPKNLENNGFIIYNLTGLCIGQHRNAGQPFWSSWHKGEPMTLLAASCEVSKQFQLVFV